MRDSPTSEYLIKVDDCEIDLKNRYFAAALALLWPGAGHFYQGRRNKAYLFAVCILGLFALGMFIGNARVVYASFTADDFRLQFPAQVCVGLPAAPALLQAMRGKPAGPNNRFLGGLMAPPIDKTELSHWHNTLSAGFELGSLYTSVAGLLNLLVVFDAFAGPMPLPHTDERRKKRKSGSTDDADNESNKQNDVPK